jgi:hypothetical protein
MRPVQLHLAISPLMLAMFFLTTFILLFTGLGLAFSEYARPLIRRRLDKFIDLTSHMRPVQLHLAISPLMLAIFFFNYIHFAFYRSWSCSSSNRSRPSTAYLRLLAPSTFSAQFTTSFKPCFAAILFPIPATFSWSSSSSLRVGVEQACAAKIKVMPCYASEPASASTPRGSRLQIAFGLLLKKQQFFRRGRYIRTAATGNV